MKNDETKGPHDIPLGLIEIGDKAFEHDLSVSSKYQAFSTELLRLSLLGIAALGFLLKEIVFNEKNSARITELSSKLSSPFTVCLSLLGLSALAALLHRYTGPDSIACHLSSLRRYKRAIGKNDENLWRKYWKEIRSRNKKLNQSKYLLLISGLSLFAGAIVMVGLFIYVLS